MKIQTNKLLPFLNWQTGQDKSEAQINACAEETENPNRNATVCILPVPLKLTKDHTPLSQGSVD